MKIKATRRPGRHDKRLGRAIDRPPVFFENLIPVREPRITPWVKWRVIHGRKL
jgi:hypothetical protein